MAALREGPRVDTAQLMELLSVSLGAYYGDFIVAAASENLTASQGKALTVLRRGPVAMRSPAETMACDASHVTGIIYRLEQRGLVRRGPDTFDRRVKNVVLTAEGEHLTDAIRAKTRTTKEGIERLGEQERASLYTLLERVFVSRPVA